MNHKGKKSKNLKQPNKNKNQNTKSSSESNSLRTWRSLGGHSTWLVAFTIAISKSYDEKTNPNHKPNITLNPMMKKHLKCQWIHIQNDWKKKRGKEDLEFTVDLGKANHGWVLECTIGFSETFKGTHYLFCEFSITHLGILPNVCDIDVEEERKREKMRENERKRREVLLLFFFSG